MIMTKEIQIKLVWNNFWPEIYFNLYNIAISLPGLEINFVEYWPIGHLSQILTGQIVSFTGHV